MYIKGIGMTKFGLDNNSSQKMIYEASFEALEDADMSPDDMDAIVVTNMDLFWNGERQRHSASMINSVLSSKTPVIRVIAGCSGGGNALWTAQNLGFDNVLVIGFERLVSSSSELRTDEILMGSERIYEQAEGMIFPAQNALVAQQHFLRYGSNSDDLALVALKNHDNAYMNPKAAFYKKKVTLEQIKKSPMVATPLRLFDCSLSVNGAAAAVLTSDRTDIEIVGSGLATDSLPTFERDDMTTWEATKRAASAAYEQAGVSASDIDFAEVHDAFTIVELMAYEDLGFADKGKGQKLIQDNTTRLDGRLPVNMSGGLKAKGHPISATGLSQIYELAKQLRSEAAERQVKGKTALAQNIGGCGGTVSVHILKKVAG